MKTPCCRSDNCGRAIVEILSQPNYFILKSIVLHNMLQKMLYYNISWCTVCIARSHNMSQNHWGLHLMKINTVYTNSDNNNTHMKLINAPNFSFNYNFPYLDPFLSCFFPNLAFFKVSFWQILLKCKLLRISLFQNHKNIVITVYHTHIHIISPQLKFFSLVLLLKRLCGLLWSSVSDVCRETPWSPAASLTHNSSL